MFKSARWRSEKKKIEMVFKLQFHATQVKAEGLTISVGKWTEKAPVLEGSCRWESPVFETVKFLQDVETGKLNPRICHLTVSTTGSTKSGLVGQTSIDLADYVDAIKTCNVSLPLRNPNSNSKPMLHVSIQRLLDPHSVSLLDTLGQVQSTGDHIQQNHSTMHTHLLTDVYDEPHISESDWSGSSDQGITTDDSVNSSNDTFKTSSDHGVQNLKAELVALARRADLSELELQSLRKQIVKETKRSQDLLREVTSLKHERDSLIKASDKQREEAKIRNKLQRQGTDPQTLLQETREELDYEKHLNSTLRLQLQRTQESNAALILAVQDLEAMLGQRSKKPVDLPRPRICENTEESRRSCASETDDDEDQKALDELVKGHMDAKDAHVLQQRITDLYNDIEISKRDKEELEIQVEQLALDYEILKQENHDISYKLEQSQVQEQLKMQYECSSSLVNVNELEIQVESLESKLKKQSEDFSESLCRIKELETQIEGMEEELEKQAQIFEADIEAVTRAKVEQEQRAIEAEEALRKTRGKNASVASKIQDEFKRISAQMSFTFAANEKMAIKAMAETQVLRMQKRQLEELLMNANDELRANRVEYKANLNEISEKMDLVEKSKHLESQKRQEEDVNADSTQEITWLRDEIEILRLEVEADASFQIRNREVDEVAHRIASIKKESEFVADEREAVITVLKSELETERALCDDLRKRDHEIEKHGKQVVQVGNELKKKEEEMANLENAVTKTEEGSNEERTKLLEEQNKLKENAVEASPKMFIKKENDLKNHVKALETKLNELSQNNAETGEPLHVPEALRTEALPSKKSVTLLDLVNEVASLREQNGLMKMELKEMEGRYSEMSLRFAEGEGERQQLVMTVRYLKNAKKS